MFYEEHEQPYDFYRYTQFAWRRYAERLDLEVRQFEWLEGFYGTFSHQLAFAARELPRRHAPAKLVASIGAHWFARRELRRKVVDRGMPKNYIVVLRKLDASTSV